MHVTNRQKNMSIANEKSKCRSFDANALNSQRATSRLQNRHFLIPHRNEKTSTTTKQFGVTLIEMVIFIAIVSIAFTGIIMVFISTGKHSADPLIKIRTIELGQSFLEEILLKKYDEGAPVNGGCVDFTVTNSRCSSGVAGKTVLQADTDPITSITETRGTFDDVDDYHNLEYCGSGVSSGDASCSGSCTNLVNESGIDIASQYSGYSICIQVSFAGSELNNVAPGTGTNVLSNDAKRIDVMVTDPLDSSMTFTTYKLNF